VQLAHAPFGVVSQSSGDTTSYFYTSGFQWVLMLFVCINPTVVPCFKQYTASVPFPAWCHKESTIVSITPSGWSCDVSPTLHSYLINMVQKIVIIIFYFYYVLSYIYYHIMFFAFCIVSVGPSREGGSL
jgi:hypothetical protein